MTRYLLGLLMLAPAGCGGPAANKATSAATGGPVESPEAALPDAHGPRFEF